MSVPADNAPQSTAPVGRRRVLAVAATAILLLALVCADGMAAKDDMLLVSRATGPVGAKGNGLSFAIVLSNDGRYAAFTSAASNLHPADPDRSNDILARDLSGNVTSLVSRASGPEGAKANGPSVNPSISGDAHLVAFDSKAANLDPADGDMNSDVYARDLAAATTVLVSRAGGPAGAKGNGPSFDPAVPFDGRYVVFTSQATNFDPADTTTGNDVYIRDPLSATTALVSRASGPSGPKRVGASYDAAVSDNGRYVAFTSAAPNLDPADQDTVTDVFVRDLETATTTLVSRATGIAGEHGNGPSLTAAVSEDGRYVAFTSQATNLDPADTDTNAHVFVRDMRNATTTLASRADGQGAISATSSAQPAISNDGRFVAFASTATNLEPGLDGDDLDVFVRDVELRRTTLVSRESGFAGADLPGISSRPTMSGDARYVGLSSANIVDSQYLVEDVYVRDAQLAARDTDEDGFVDSADKCPRENSLARDGDANGCLDKRTVKGSFLFDPGRYFRRRNGRIELLGVSVQSIVGQGLHPDVVVEVTCTRRACPKQRQKVGSDRKVSFRKLRKRKLRTGVNVIIRAERRGYVGQHIEYTVVPGDTTKRYFCVRPGTTREVVCRTK